MGVGTKEKKKEGRQGQRVVGLGSSLTRFRIEIGIVMAVGGREQPQGLPGLRKGTAAERIPRWASGLFRQLGRIDFRKGSYHFRISKGESPF